MLDQRLDSTNDTTHERFMSSKQVAHQVASQIATMPVALRAKDIHRMNKDDLLKVQHHMRLGSEWGVVELPTSWLPKNSQRTKRRTNIYGWLDPKLDEAERELAVLTCVRLFLLMLIVPSKPSRSKPAQTLAPSTVVSNVQRSILPLIREAVSKPRPANGKLLTRVDRKTFPQKDSVYSVFKAEYARIDQYTERGYWDDPVGDSDPDTTFEKSNRGTRRPQTEREKGGFRPLPDRLVHGAGAVSAWIVQNLSPAVIDVYTRVCNVRVGTADNNNKKIQELLASTKWIATDGATLQLPAELSSVSFPPKNYPKLLALVGLCQNAHFFIISLSAGPRASEILDFDTNVIVESADGMVLARGRTFKIVDAVDGALRDWPLPSLAAEAVHQQVRLSKAITNAIERSSRNYDARMAAKVNHAAIKSKMAQLGVDLRWIEKTTGVRIRDLFKKGPDTSFHIEKTVLPLANALDMEPHEIAGDDIALRSLQFAMNEPGELPKESSVEPLWRQTSVMHFAKAWANGYNEEMRHFIHTLGMTHLLDTQPFTHHRFRKTIARLVALCYAHAPKILMDIFGHRDIDMTLHYILEDSSLLQEIEYNRTEIMRMKATDVVRNISSCGGPAKKKIMTAVEEIRTAKGDFTANDTEELANLLTVDGRYWEYVRPGIICTKLKDEVGPCNKGRSFPNPASCNALCSHRLEEAELRAECDAVIGELVKYLSKAWAQNDDIMASMWSGQIMTHLRRFDEVFAKWNSHSVVIQLLNQEKSKEVRYG